MAKLVTETITITLSKMVKNSDKEANILDAEMLAGLEAVVTELAGEGVMVEIE
jgi:hypothetical protein